MMGEVAPSLAYTDGIVFAVNEYARLAAIKLEGTPEILWESETASDSEVNHKEVEFINKYKSNNLTIGYNQWPKPKNT